MSRIGPGDSYWSGVLPAVIVFGLGLTLVVAPVTATVMAAADERHSGIASGINTAASRLAGRVNPGPGKTSFSTAASGGPAAPLTRPLRLRCSQFGT
jgi:hypothetical protein